MKDTIPVNRPLLAGNELTYVKECIESGWISSEGPFVGKFEKAFADYHKLKYAVAVSSGTAAIDCAITSLSLSPGDEIILPTFTIISCINQIVRLGLKPVFVDCDLSTFNMNPSDVLKKINIYCSYLWTSC
jgi:perosamine synthetase